MPKAKSSSVQADEMKAKFLKRSGELWDTHYEEFFRVCKDSEKKKLNVGFTAGINLAESTAKLKTSISFSEPFTDDKEDDFENPEFVKQNPPLPGVDLESTRGRKSRNGVQSEKP